LEKEARAIINTLSANTFYATCPCCGETIVLGKANLFYSDQFNKKAQEIYQSHKEDLVEQKHQLKVLKESISTKSEIGARAVNIGLIFERVFASLEQFPFCCGDCRSLFDPIDYLVFEGLTTKGIVEKLLWVEIKTGDARLNRHQKDIKGLIEGGQLSWETYETGEK
jgi:predicted Holliday junction resolvase-like endonuclease